MSEKRTLLFLVLVLVMPSATNPQLETPPTNNDEEYQPPNLSRGLGTVGDGGENAPPARRRYPDRSRDRSQQGEPRSAGGYDPGSVFRQPPQPNEGSSGRAFQYEPYPPGDYPRSNSSSAFSGPSRGSPTSPPRAPTPLPATTTQRPSGGDGGGGRQDKKRKDPFEDPNRYRIPQQHEVRDGVMFVNGRPYR